LPDARFYTSAGPFTALQLADITGVSIAGPVSPDKYYDDVATLTSASGSHVSFIDNKRYVGEFRSTHAGAVFLAKGLEKQSPRGTLNLISSDPYLAYAKTATAFYPDIYASQTIPNQTALISETASLGNGVRISPGAVVMAGAEIGNGSVIGPNAVIGPGVVIGDYGWIGANVTLSFCCIGRNLIAHPGARIGQDGYGFSPGAPRHFKVPQLGRVIIGDDVEIGANTCVDRGSLRDTVIGNGTKLDNLVHIAHNVTIGEGCFITGQVGIAGSSNIGNHVMLGGQAGISGHLSIGDNVKVAAKAGVSKDVEPGQTVAGYPAMDVRKFWRNLAVLNKLSKQKK